MSHGKSFEFKNQTVSKIAIVISAALLIGGIFAPILYTQTAAADTTSTITTESSLSTSIIKPLHR